MTLTKKILAGLLTLSALAIPRAFSAPPGGFNLPATTLSPNQAAAKDILYRDASAAEAAQAVAVRQSLNPSAKELLNRESLLTPRGTAKTASATQPTRLQAAKVAGTVTQGYYIGKDWVMDGDEVNCAMELTVDTDNANLVHISNFYGLGETIDATVDRDAGTISIAPQFIYKHNYGDLYIYPIERTSTGINFFPEGVLQGTIDSKGVIRLPSWGAIVKGGTNNGVLLAPIEKAEYHPSNAMMNATKFYSGEETPIAYPLLLEQADPSMLKIYNFGTTGVPVKARVDPKGNVTVSPQFIVNLTLYGDFLCFPINGSSVDRNNPIAGVYDKTGGKISFGPWVAMSMMQEGLVALNLTKCDCVFGNGFNFELPASHAFNLEGSGTQASPFLVKTPADLQAISEASLVNSFPGQYFRLANDIDMSAVKNFLPIGTSKTAFNGEFDGNGKTISNLTIDAVAYNFQGLFGAVYTAGAVKNLTLANVDLSGSGYYLGSVAGYSMGTIENCHVSGKVNTLGVNVGGIVGRSYGAVRNASMSGSVTGIGYLGGVVGYSYGELSKISSDATVAMDQALNVNVGCTGGIAGLAQSQSLDGKEGQLSDLLFSGKVTSGASTAFTGGITGYMYYCDAVRLVNTGSVTGTYIYGSDIYCGGITGIIRQSTMRAAFNAGTITSPQSSMGGGGLFGYISTSYSTIGGMLESIDVASCVNVGQVLGKQKTATCGIFGTEFVSDFVPEKPSDKGIKDVYIDVQITGVADSRFGLTTKALTGALPAGLAELWTAYEGLYPMPKNFFKPEGLALAKSVINFADGESTRMVKSGANAPVLEKIEWKLYANGSAVATGEGLKQNGTSFELTGVYGTDTIMAMNNGAATGRFIVASSVPKHFAGSGTAEDPYIIANKADFIKLHDAVMHYDHVGDHFLQTADVDFEFGDDFHGVGAGNHTLEFAGIFDGGNKRIKGMKVKSFFPTEKGTAGEGSYNYAGLFHITTESSVIKNVIIDASCSYDTYAYAGSVVGYARGKVENCRNYANIVSNGNMTGGIVGNTTATTEIRNCYNGGDLTVSRDYAGGIAGQSLGIITGCQNDGDITGVKYVGGICAAQNGKLSLCVNSGAISGSDYTGGIVGYNVGEGEFGAVTDCFSSGIILCPSNNRGGVIGLAGNHGEIARNFFDGSVNNMYGCSSLSQGFTSLASGELAVATAPEGFDKDAYAFSATAYPSLKAFANEPAGLAKRSVFVRFGKGEKNINVTRDLELSADSNIDWKLAKGTEFSLADGKLKIAMPEKAVVTDTLTAVYANKYSKVYPLKAIPTILPGTGSADAPFIISSADDLDLLADFMATSLMDYDGYYFRVEKDIEYAKSRALKPIALTGVQFQGDFNGNNKTISGFTFTDETSKTGKNIGLFGTVGSNGSIHNLTVSGKINAYSYSGAIAGLLYGKIDSCTVVSDIDGKGGYIGGFTGRMYDGAAITNSEFYGKVGGDYMTNINYQGGFAGQIDDGALIKNSTNFGIVGNYNPDATTVTGTQYTGGIAGINLGTIENCRNEGIIKGRMHIAGIAGRVGKSGRFFDCSNKSNISCPGSYVGGIAPQTAGSGLSRIERCFNTGNLRGKGYVAGIIGAVTNGMTILDCYNTGNIEGFSTTSYSVGGVIGQLQGTTAYPSEVRRCYNTGDVYNESNSTGGFVGKVGSAAPIYDCYNTGNVTEKREVESTSENGVGGFAGSFCGYMENVWNSGTVTSNIPATGGLVGTGAMPIGQIYKSANFGNVISTRKTGSMMEKGFGFGGFYGGYGPQDIRDCYNFGSVTAPDSVAGFHGALWSNGNGGTTITRCYNAGKVIATSAEPKMVSNFALLGLDTKNVKPELMKLDSVYFDTDTCVNFGVEAYGKGLSRKELMTAALGDAFRYGKACLPILANLDSVAVANFHAAYIDFKDGDSPESVSKSFTVGLQPNVTWTSSSNLEISDEGEVVIKNDGKGWVMAETTLPDTGKTKLQKVYSVTLAVSGAADEIADGKEIKAVEYFNLNGVAVERPAAGGIYIIRTRYTDGSSQVRKAVVK